MNDQQQLQIVRASVHRFIGRLSQDPALRFFDSGNAVANSRLLVNQPGARRDDPSEPDGFKLEIWGARAQEFADSCAKGSLIDVVGRVKIESWDDRTTGEQRQQPVITVEQWALLRPANQQQPAPAPAQRTAPAPAPAPVRRGAF